MTDEERQRTMDFIMAQQAQFWASIQKLEESQARLEEIQHRAAVKTNRHDHQMDRVERILKLVIKAGLRERKLARARHELFERRMEALRESQANSDRRVDALTASQAHSDKRLEALIDIVREQRNGRA